MAKFCAQTMPYRGLGSGIPRVLADKSKVDFLDDKEGNQFTAIVSRPDLSTNSVSFIAKSDDKSRGSVEETVEKSVEETVEKSVEKVWRLMKESPHITTLRLAQETGLSRRGVEEIIKSLKKQGRIQRVGPDKGGHWEVIEEVSK